jgi:hypothetical protein
VKYDFQDGSFVDSRGDLKSFAKWHLLAPVPQPHLRNA